MDLEQNVCQPLRVMLLGFMSLISEKQVEQMKNHWAQCIISRDDKSLLSLYADQALLKPTLSDQIRQGHEQIKPYFTGSDKTGEKGFLNQGIINVTFMEAKNIQTHESWVDVGSYVFKKKDGSVVQADYTFVFIKTHNNQIQIGSHHSSLTYSAKV